MKTVLCYAWLLLLPFCLEAQPSEVFADDLPLDGVVAKSSLSDKRVLPYPDVQQKDVLWEKRLWRVIDTRERMNQVFRYPKQYFFEILLQGIEEGHIRAFSPENDGFRLPLAGEEALGSLQKTDTVWITDPVTQQVSMQVVENLFDPARIVRYRLKEVWYFDQVHSTLRVRILGIAPLLTDTDAQGQVRYERPLFWVYFPECRDWLSRHDFFQEGNDQHPMNWADLFEMRRFASYIVKENNVRDERLEDYLSGLEQLLEGEHIKSELFNAEHDLWSY